MSEPSLIQYIRDPSTWQRRTYRGCSERLSA